MRRKTLWLFTLTLWLAMPLPLASTSAQQIIPAAPAAAPPATKPVLVTAPIPPATTDFAKLIERLSDNGGYFDSDNLISNEASFQHVMGALRKRNVTGGAYLGVGPDTGFTYLAQIRPKLALMGAIKSETRGVGSAKGRKRVQEWGQGDTL